MSPVPSPELSAALAQLRQAVEALAGAVGADSARPPAPPASPSGKQPASVVEVINEFLISKAKAQRSIRYLQALRVSLGAFARGRERRPLASIGADEVEQWIENRHWRARTRRGYLLDVRTLFNWARRRGFVSENPVERLELPQTVQPAPKVHSPCQVAEVLEAARKRDLSACRLLAIRYFAGIRSAEAHRMGEDSLHLESGFVEVRADVSKTRARRLVPITETLRAWLNLGGALPVTDEDRIRRAVAGAGVPWFPNVTRHSFCSYRLASVQSAAQVALEAGHSEAMLFRHYREIVTPGESAEFWAIRPVEPKVSEIFTP